MVIDVKKCLKQGKFNGDFAFDFEPDASDVDIPYVVFSTPVRVKGRFHVLEDDSLEVEGEISYTLKGLCSRCLKETEEKVVYAFHEYFTQEENGEDYSCKNGQADLAEVASDAVLLSMPHTLLCKDGCEMIAYHS